MGVVLGFGTEGTAPGCFWAGMGFLRGFSPSQAGLGCLLVRARCGSGLPHSDLEVALRWTIPPVGTAASSWAHDLQQRWKALGGGLCWQWATRS